MEAGIDVPERQQTDQREENTNVYLTTSLRWMCGYKQLMTLDEGDS